MKTRAIILGLLFALGFSAPGFASESDSQFSSYKGKTYPLENQSVCSADLLKIVERLDQQKGFKVLDGGCVSYRGHSVQIQFSYSHPMGLGIDRFERETQSQQVCKDLAITSEAAFAQAGAVELDSYCEGKKVVVDYVDLSNNVIHDLRADFHFSKKSLCQDFLKDFKFKAAKHNITAFFGNCKKMTSDILSREYHVPQISLSSHFSQSLKFIAGKRLEAGEACFANSNDVSDNFEKAGISLVDTFCADMGYDQRSHEVIAYLDQMKDPSWIRSFKGVVYGDAEVCANQLEKASINLSSLGNDSLYKFCKASSHQRFQPVIYYTEKKEI